MIYFTADTHFYHANIIKYCNRPFQNVEEMNEKLIENWNKIISPKDVVYVIGDFVFGHAEKQATRIIELVRSLKGNILLIKGSHDKLDHFDPSTLGKDASRFKIFQDRIVTISYENQEIVLCHYAMRVWPKSHFGTWHLFGHSHGKLEGLGKSFDVGVDCWNFKPLSFPEICGIMKTKPDNFNLIKNSGS